MGEAAFALAIAALAWLWYDSMRAREHAVAAGRVACERDGLQLLDDTVECVSVRPARALSGHARLRRIYRFEFSDTGDNRRAGRIVMLGAEVESLTMDPFLMRRP